jgi:drug/metabolite transporter (DMT)-like permease
MTRSEARKSGLPDTVFSGSNYWFYSKFGPERALAGDSGAFPANSPVQERADCRRILAPKQLCGGEAGGAVPSAIAPPHATTSRRQAIALRELPFMPGISAASPARRSGWLLDQPYLLLSLTSLFWACNTIMGRGLVGHVPPMTLAFIRWAGAAIILLPFAARHIVQDWPVIRKHAAIMLLLSFTGFSIYNTMAYYGLQYTTAINGLLLQSIAPLFVAIWTFALFGDRLTFRQAVGVCVSLTGVVVIICHGSLAVLLGIDFNRGDVMFVIALLVYSFYAAMLRKRPPINPLSFLAVSMGLGAIMLIPAVIWELASGKTLIIDTESLLSFAFVCIFPSLLGYLFLNRGIELIGPNRAAPFIHLVPVFGSVLAIALLGERFELFHAVGYGLVFSGITIATRKSSAGQANSQSTADKASA